MPFAFQKIDFICNNNDRLLRVISTEQTNGGRHLQNGGHPVRKDAVIGLLVGRINHDDDRIGLQSILTLQWKPDESIPSVPYSPPTALHIQATLVHRTTAVVEIQRYM